MIGQTQALAATAQDASGAPLTGRPVTWTTSSASVVTVSTAGVATAIAVGTATITATVEGKTATAVLTVSVVPVATVSVSPSSASLVIGQTQALAATAQDASGNGLTGRTVSWSTNATGVATVSASGVVTAIAVGSAIITATVEGKTASATVAVSPVPVASVQIVPASTSIPVGGVATLSAVAKDAGGTALTGRSVSWVANNPTIATISAVGVVTGVSSGSTTVTATSEGVSTTAAVAVTPVDLPVAVSFSGGSLSVPVGGTTTLTWNAINASTCSAAGGWAGPKSISGSETVGPLAFATDFALTCIGPSSSAGATVVVTVTGTATDRFPLQVQAGKRYLIDAKGQPFLMQGDSPWDLISTLTREQVDSYLEDRRLKGFNTVMVELMEHYFSPNPPKDVYGDAPFLAPGDFSQPNEAYFAHAAYVIGKAREKGMLVLLTPAYLGFGGGAEGWYQEMVTAGPTVLQQYGQYLATRFRAYDNILWVHGGDYVAANMGLVRAIANGIRATEPKWLHTYHSSRGISALSAVSVSTDPWLQVNTAYSDEAVLTRTVVEYNRSTMPFFLIEARYEGESGAGELVVRRQAYQANLSGAMGQLMGNSPIWDFKAGWQAALNSGGSRTVAFVHQLLQGRPWWTLQPDLSNQLLRAGVGASPNQAVASRAQDRSFGIVYVPTTRPVTLDLGQLAGPRVVARWYDPTNGTFSSVAGSPFAGGGTVSVTTPATNSRGFGDWVLVLESIP